MASSPFKIRADFVSASASVPTVDVSDRFGSMQPQEVVLGLLGEYVEPAERAWSGGLVHVLGDLGFSIAAARVALNRIIARGLLSPEKEGRFVFYRITPRLQLVHDEGRRQTFVTDVDPEWSGDWTIVLYSALDERAQRARLGRWLGLRGFGQLQEGVWLAPGRHDQSVTNLVRRLGLDKQVLAFLGDLGTGYDVGQLVARVWNVRDLQTRYRIFIEQFSPHLIRLDHVIRQPREAFILRTQLIETFRQAVVHDPRISESVVAIDQRTEAISLFRTLEAALSPAATAYFRGWIVDHR